MLAGSVPGQRAIAAVLPEARPLLLFLLLFLGGTAVHFLTRPYVGPVVNRLLNAQAAARLIGVFSPAERVHATGSRLGSADTYVEVAQGCEGIDVMLMLIAALAAFPMARRKKVLGIITGVLLVYLANLSRIVGLWYCLRHWPASFNSMHLVVGQTALIVIGVVFFAAWTGVLERTDG